MIVTSHVSESSGALRRKKRLHFLSQAAGLLTNIEGTEKALMKGFWSPANIAAMEKRWNRKHTSDFREALASIFNKTEKPAHTAQAELLQFLCDQFCAYRGCRTSPKVLLGRRAEGKPPVSLGRTNNKFIKPELKINLNKMASPADTLAAMFEGAMFHVQRHGRYTNTFLRIAYFLNSNRMRGYLGARDAERLEIPHALQARNRGAAAAATEALRCASTIVENASAFFTKPTVPLHSASRRRRAPSFAKAGLTA
jgi:hypothetical protein